MTSTSTCPRTWHRHAKRGARTKSWLQRERLTCTASGAAHVPDLKSNPCQASLSIVPHMYCDGVDMAIGYGNWKGCHLGAAEVLQRCSGDAVAAATAAA